MTANAAKGKLFGQCMSCGARFLVLAMPVGIEVGLFVQLLRRVYCPYCLESKEIGLCETDGPHAVTRSRPPQRRPTPPPPSTPPGDKRADR